jgi:hypothetical protein
MAEMPTHALEAFIVIPYTAVWVIDSSICYMGSAAAWHNADEQNEDIYQMGKLFDHDTQAFVIKR